MREGEKKQERERRIERKRKREREKERQGGTEGGGFGEDLLLEDGLGRLVVSTDRRGLPPPVVPAGIALVQLVAKVLIPARPQE